MGKIGGILLGLVMAAGHVRAAESGFADARKLYDLTDYNQSIQILNGLHDKSAAALELLGRNHYMQGDYKKATEALEKALAADPNSSEISLWLGRAYGRRAETSSPFT